MPAKMAQNLDIIQTKASIYQSDMMLHGTSQDNSTLFLPVLFWILNFWQKAALASTFQAVALILLYRLPASGREENGDEFK